MPLTLQQFSIVFIHSITEGREKTWTAKNASSPWPQTLLPTKIPDARILAFGYDPRVLVWFDTIQGHWIRDHASTLLVELSRYRERDDTVSAKRYCYVDNRFTHILERTPISVCLPRGRRSSV
jgi:hypothetical protein